MDAPSSAFGRAALDRLVGADAVGQLVRREGLMAELGRDAGVDRLDWVDEVAALLAEPTRLEAVESTARGLWRQGTRHLIWSGMGGSINAVRVLTEAGFCQGGAAGVAVYPLDSTDPVALDSLLRDIASAKGLPPDAGTPTVDDLRRLLHDTHLVAVSMGITSEEPASHLAWYVELLGAAGLPPAGHITVLTVEGSYLQRHARQHALPVRPVYLGDRSGFPGRMSAPATLVFLLPAALHFAGEGEGADGGRSEGQGEGEGEGEGGDGRLRDVLRLAWQAHDLAGAQASPQRHPFVRLAAALADASDRGRCRLLLSTPFPGHALSTWIEQLLEQSLGKGGRGVVVFDTPADHPRPRLAGTDLLRLCVRTDTAEAAGADPAGGPRPAADEECVTLRQPGLADPDPVRRLAALAATFLGWQLATALYGYLHDIRIVDEPAVERYKAHARALRELPDPLAVADTAPFADRVIRPDRAGYPDRLAALADALVGPGTDTRDRSGHLGYLDLTVNGEPPAGGWPRIEAAAAVMGGDLLGTPVKVRRAPAAYHVSEQSEMDGPANLVSIRAVCRSGAQVRVGSYPRRLLVAQAVASWRAMNEVDRRCYLIVVDDWAGLERVLADLAGAIRTAPGRTRGEERHGYSVSVRG